MPAKARREVSFLIKGSVAVIHASPKHKAQTLTRGGSEQSSSAVLEIMGDLKSCFRIAQGVKEDP